MLEVGAGPGLLAKRILDDRPDLRLIVTDYSPQMLDLARANLERSSADTEEAEKHRDRFELVQANAMDLSIFAGRGLDGVYSMGAIKHFPDPVQGLCQSASTLAVGGILYFADSCSDGTLEGTRALVARLSLSRAPRTLLTPLIHLGLKRESPSASEVESWASASDCGGAIDVEFSEGRSMFKLTLKKTEVLNSAFEGD